MPGFAPNYEAITSFSLTQTYKGMNKHIHISHILCLKIKRRRETGWADNKTPHLILAMKLTLMLVFIFSIKVSAMFSQQVTLSVKNAPLEEVMQQVKAQTGYTFFFDAKYLSQAGPVTVSIQQAAIRDALKAIFSNQPFGYQLNNKVITIHPKSISPATSNMQSGSQQQGITIRGTVTGPDGKGLSGVNIRAEGSGRGTVTNSEGTYMLRLPKPATVIYSFVGFKTERRTVSAGATINVKLSGEEDQLDEVVVIGYGAVARKDLTGSVGTVKMTDMDQAPVASFDEALAGRVAGVQVSADEGQPGAAMNVVIRGQNSITQSNQPLYVIDGFPMEDFEASEISTADIESITVLKDASSTAIYGARGANGVIVIETKKGLVSTPIITYGGQLGTQRVLKTMDVMSPYEFVKYQIERNPAQAATSYLTNGKTLESYREVQGYNWQDRLFRRGSTMNHTLSVRGGNESTKYSFSASLFNQDGVIISSAFDRIQGRLIVDQKLSKKVSATLNVMYSDGVVNGPSPAVNASQSSNYLMFNAWGYRPITGANLNLEDDLFDPDVYNPDDDERGFDYRMNPILSTQNEVVTRQTRLFSPNLNLVYDIHKNLSLNVRGGTTLRNYTDENFFNSQTRRGATRPTNVNGVNGSVMNAERSSWMNENTLTYKKTVKHVHKVTALGGFTIQAYNYNRYGYSAVLIPNEGLGLSGLDEGLHNLTYAEESRSTLVSFLSRAEYDYRSRYLFTASFRADGSSKLAPDNRWSYFPSGAFAWRMSRERFMKNIDFIHDAKLRVSYGVTGNNRVSDFSYRTSLYMPVASAYSFGGLTPNRSMVPNRLGNSQLKWENTSQLNLGYDLTLFKGKVELNVDAYRKTTYDLLLDANIPYTTGFATAYKNIGKVQNQGLEFTLSTTNIRNKEFRWTSNFNISFNNNKVLALAESEDNMLTPMIWDSGYNGVPLYITEIGRPIAMFYGYVWDGVYKPDEFDDVGGGNYLLKANVPSNGANRTSIRPGNIKFKDLNGDGIIDSKDATILGDGVPKHMGGFANNFQYKEFRLHVFFQWSYGNDVYNANRLMLEENVGNRSHLNQFASYADRWSFDNQESLIPLNNGQSHYGVYSSRVLEDASYLRLKTLSLSYSIPPTWINRVRLKALSLSANLQNVLTWTSYSGMDPEVGIRSTALTPGFDYSAYPHARTVTLRLTATF